MYLSKITLVQSDALVEILIKLQKNDAYATHQLLWQLFHHQDDRQFIYRQELQPNGLPIFWVLSHVEPDVSFPQWSIQTKTFLPLLQKGQRLAFKLRANPTVWNNTTKKRHDVMMNTKYQAMLEGIDKEKLPELMQQAARQWLCDTKRIDNWGISFDVVPDIESCTQHRSEKRSGQHIKFTSVDYQGILTVQDPDKFLKQYSQGFGRAKAFGCGLMLIRGI